MRDSYLLPVGTIVGKPVGPGSGFAWPGPWLAPPVGMIGGRLLVIGMIVCMIEVIMLPGATGELLAGVTGVGRLAGGLLPGPLGTKLQSCISRCLH